LILRQSDQANPIVVSSLRLEPSIDGIFFGTSWNINGGLFFNIIGFIIIPNDFILDDGVGLVSDGSSW
jgi:hypothetical protein